MKKITLALLFAGTYLFAFAQIDTLALQKEMATMTWKALTEQVDAAYAKKDYQLSLQYAKQAVSVASTQFGEQHENYIRSLADLGEVWRKLNNYPKSLAIQEVVYIKTKTVLGTSHPKYDNYIGMLAAIYRKLGKYEPAATLYLEAIAILEQTKRENHPRYISHLVNLAISYWQTGQYQKAIPIYERVLSITEQTKGKNHKRYGTYLNNLALVYQKLGQYEAAIKLYQEALSITEKTEGKSATNYAKWLNNLSTVYQEMGQLNQSVDLLKQALIIIEKKRGKDHPAYAKWTGNLALSYQKKGQYKKASQLYETALKSLAKKLGVKHPEYAYLLKGLGATYLKMGQYEKAKPLFVKALEILQNAFGKKHPTYIQALTNLAIFYYDIGQFNQALPLFLNSLTISEETLGKTHPNHGFYLNNLAALYRKIGQWNQARLYQQAALDNTLSNFGKEHPTYALRLNNLAEIYSQLSELDLAKVLFEEAVDITKRTIGKNHPDYSNRLTNLAINYTQLGLYNQADSLFIVAIQNAANSVGKNHIRYISCLAAQADFYVQSAAIPKAIELYEEVLHSAIAALGKQHPTIGTYTTTLASLYTYQQQYEQAYPLFEIAAANFQQQLNNYYPAISEQERIVFLQILEKNIHQLYSFARHYPAISTTIQNLQLHLKGLALADTKAIKNILEVSNDSTLQAKHLQWKVLRRQLAQASTLSLAEQVEKGWSVELLQKEASLLEGELARHSTTVATTLTNQIKQPITVEAVQAELGKKEKAIDIFHFRYHNGRTWTDSTFYYALVNTAKAKQPDLVYLSTKKELARVLRAKIRPRGANYIENKKISQDLYQLVWQPLLPFLKKTKRIYLSPTGLLHQVAFASLQSPANKNTRLLHQYELAYYGNLRDYVLQKPVERPDNPSITLVGGALYDLDSIALVKKVKPSLNPIAITSLPPNNDAIALRSVTEDSLRAAIRFNYLPGTLQEVQAIAQQFENQQWGLQTFLEAEATEDNIKTLSGQHKSHILHLSTHGYFFPVRQSNKLNKTDNLRDRIRFADNPLLRSGLVFTGVNHVWEGGKAIEGIEDGLLTAYEIANMDLQNTQLVALSACQTAQGDVQNGEGVFGLQRAFKTAGVPYLLASLWKVPDKETAQLMELFYQYYLAGAAPRIALQKAQKEMSSQYSPFYWAAFILIE